MRSKRRVGTWAWILAAGATGGLGCGGEPPAEKSPTAPAVESQCGDGRDDDGDGHVDCEDADCRVPEGSGCELAPALDRGVATTIWEAGRFLYEGKDPIQRGVEPGSLVAGRTALVRGHVVDASGEALGGVRVSVVGREELGHTLTHSDGAFDMVLPGGRQAVLSYSKQGYHAAERVVTPGMERHEVLAEVGLVPLPENETRIASNAERVQHAVGDLVEDELGARQPFVVFAAGTEATLDFATGKDEALKSFSLGISEYPFELPRAGERRRFSSGSLPGGSGLHYELELEVKEARERGARGVSFSKPVSLYVENFLGLPVGAPVPLGYYQRGEGQWRDSGAGRVIEVLGESDGVAEVDTDGDGLAEAEAALADLGVTTEELEVLAERYDVGATLWRAPVTHFSPKGVFLPLVPEAGALAPTVSGLFSRPLERASRRGPLLVEPQAATHSVSVVGTPYRLHYQSNRTPGYRAGFELDIPLIPGAVPAGLKQVVARFAVAGKERIEAFTPKAGLEWLVEWNGRDAFDRELQGPQTAQIRVTYVYDAVLKVGNGFGISGELTSEEANTLALDGVQASLEAEYEVHLGVWDNKAFGLGGYGLDVLHAFAPAQSTLFFGSGDERSGKNVALVVTDLAPDSASLGTPDGLTVTPDGTVLVTDDQEGTADPGRLLRIEPDGSVSELVGPESSVDLELGWPQGIAVASDGTVIVADYLDNAVRAIAPDGEVTTLIGDGADDPVVEADVNALDGLTLGTRGELYVINGDEVLRFEGGELFPFAGGGDGGDDGPATAARLERPSGVAVGPDKSVYISERGNDAAGHRVRRVTPDGVIQTIAGSGRPGFSGDGGDARLAELNSPRGLAIGPDGTLYIADQENDRLRRVTPEGIIHTVVGGGETGTAEGQLATEVELDAPDGVAIAPDGTLFVTAGDRVFRAAPGMPKLSAEDQLIPSEDGQLIYHFDRLGKHLETLDAMTGVRELEFDYDAAGLLSGIRDRNGQLTRIERDDSGNATAIVAPFGQRTELSVGDDGLATRVSDPLGRTLDLEHEAGLMSRLFDYKSGEHQYDYDESGRITKLTDPTGYVETIEREQTSRSLAVTVRSAEERPTVYRAEFRPGSALERSVEAPDGVKSQATDEVEVKRSFSADGTETALFMTADPYFGAQSPYPAEATTRLPSGKTLTSFNLRGKRLTDIDNALSVEEWTELTESNGRTSEVLYKRSDRSLTSTSPSGRTSRTLLDELGRPVRVERPGFGNIELEYDTLGRVIAQTHEADGKKRAVRSVYDDAGFLSQVENALSEKTNYARDVAGRVTELFLPDAESVGFEYDVHDNVLGLTPPGGEKHRFRHAEKHDLLQAYLPPELEDVETTTPLAAGEARYEYTKDLALASVQRSDGRDLEMTYDAVSGRLAQLAFGDGRLTYGYDFAGRPTSVSRSGGARLDLEWDGPLATRTTWSGAITGSVSFDYDDDARLSELAVNGASSVHYGYDDDGLVTGITSAGGAASLELTRAADSGLVTAAALERTRSEYTYTGFGEPMTLAASFGSELLFRESLTRDDLGRITSSTETHGDVVRELTYAYDARGRLIEVSDDGVVTRYEYDANGNRTSVSVDGDDTAAATYDAQDRILAHGTAQYEQTAQGDLLRRTDTATDHAIELEYDALGNLERATVSSPEASRRIEYVMDGTNRRVARRVDGVFDRAFLYQDALRPAAEIDATGTFTHFVYGEGIGGAPAMMLRSGVPYRFVKDHLGSVRLVVNAIDGTVAQELRYDAFGSVLEDTNPGFQPFGFAGGLYDPDTKLVRFGARDYDPHTGRWAAKDPSGFAGGLNLYAYCENDPINCVDPDGLEPKTLGDYAWAVADVLIREPIMCILGSECTPAEAAAYIATGAAAGRVLRTSARLLRAEVRTVAARALPPALKIVPGNAKFGIEHIVRRHAFNTVTTKPASKFAEGMGHLEIRRLIEEAARVNGSGWVSQGSKRVLETNLGRTIGTGLQGEAVGGLRIVTGADGTLITAYPIPFP